MDLLISLGLILIVIQFIPHHNPMLEVISIYSLFEIVSVYSIFVFIATIFYYHIYLFGVEKRKGN